MDTMITYIINLFSLQIKIYEIYSYIFVYILNWVTNSLTRIFPHVYIFFISEVIAKYLLLSFLNEMTEENLRFNLSECWVC